MRFLFAAAAVIALIVLLTQFWGIAIVQGSSMNPSIAEKDLVIFTRRPKDIQRGDIIVIQYDHELIVKRVAGLPEDVIEVDEQGYILRNGERVQGESAIYGQANITGDIQFPVQVQAGHYFVLGDNRPVSLDSRTSAVGQIAQQDILGEVVSWLHME